MSKERKELGCAGHFIGGAECRFTRHTQLEHYKVSTVGNYFPSRKEEHPQRRPIGLSGFFETMVFPTGSEPQPGSEGCGCRVVISWIELECQRYDTAGEANDGHEAAVERYLSEGPWERPRYDDE